MLFRGQELIGLASNGELRRLRSKIEEIRDEVGSNAFPAMIWYMNSFFCVYKRIVGNISLLWVKNAARVTASWTPACCECLL